MCFRISAGVSIVNVFSFKYLFTSDKSIMSRNSGATWRGLGGFGRKNTRLNTTFVPCGMTWMAPFSSSCCTSLTSATCLTEPRAYFDSRKSGHSARSSLSASWRPTLENGSL